MGESYEIINQEGTDIKIEVKKVFGNKISEASINSEGFYHGQGKGWDLFNGRLEQEGQWQNGYWHGRWKTFDKNGNIEMVREFEKGNLIKIFVPEGKNLQEVPRNEWPGFYSKVHQDKPKNAKGK